MQASQTPLGGGLLQIARPGLQSGGSASALSITPASAAATSSNSSIDLKNIISTTAFTIPGIPTPSLAGVLTAGIKSGSAGSLFSLPGKRFEMTPTSVSCDKAKPFVPGMPGPSTAQGSTIKTASSTNNNDENSVKSEIKIEVDDPSKTAEAGKFLRPSSLPLTPGSFKQKKYVLNVGAGATLISPETPRPRKSYMLQYQNGTAYTSIGLKCSTRVYYTTIFNKQPTYAANNPRISMYSNWKVVSKDSHPSGLTPEKGLNAYNSTLRDSHFGLVTSAGPRRSVKDSKNDMVVSHSSRWKAVKAKNKDDKADKNQDGQSSNSNNSNSNVVRTVEGGYKSMDDDYTYVRGRGRGRYVCNSCGIRCKKPSMLKKHIRTHSNFRPYHCKHCNFAFKTKGNLTKHMKSKTHHKKCVELGISPIPTTVPDEYNSTTDDNAVGAPAGVHGAVAGDSDTEDEDMDDEEEDEDDQFEDAEEEQADATLMSKGLMAYRPRLAVYPYTMVTSEASSSVKNDIGSATTAPPNVASEANQISNNTKMTANLKRDQAVSGLSMGGRSSAGAAASNLGEKYYFSTASTSNDVAKAAAESIMAMPIPSGPTASTASVEKPAEAESSHLVVGTRADPKDILSPVTGSVTVLTFIDKTTSKMTSDATASKVSDADPAELQTYIQAKAAARAAITTPFQQQQQPQTKQFVPPPVPNNTQVVILSQQQQPPKPSLSESLRENDQLQPPRNVTMNVRDMPSSSVAGPPKPVHLSAKLPGGPATPPKIHLTLPPISGMPTVQQSLIVNSPPGRSDTPPEKASSPLKTPGDPPGAPSSLQIIPKPPVVDSGSNVPAPNKSLDPKPGGNNTTSKNTCNVCKKEFPNATLLNLHGKVHQFERPFRCDSCAISFRTNGHLQKHMRSSGHFNKVNINNTFGEPSKSNPRPFYCNDCKIGFRIHGHLAKHLRSKSHIMKLENVGKLPIGMFAEMERLGTNLNEIDTSDCITALESLKQIANILYNTQKTAVPGPQQVPQPTNQNGPQTPPVVDTKPPGLSNGVPPPPPGSSLTIALSPPPQPHLGSPVAVKQEPLEMRRPPSMESTKPLSVVPGGPPPPGSQTTNRGVIMNLGIPSHVRQMAESSRRASFSSSGQDDPSTDSESVRPPYSLLWPVLISIISGKPSAPKSRRAVQVQPVSQSVD